MNTTFILVQNGLAKVRFRITFISKSSDNRYN
jgi:hypothetical protein